MRIWLSLMALTAILCLPTAGLAAGKTATGDVVAYTDKPRYVFETYGYNPFTIRFRNRSSRPVSVQFVRCDSGKGPANHLMLLNPPKRPVTIPAGGKTTMPFLVSCQYQAKHWRPATFVFRTSGARAGTISTRIQFHVDPSSD